MIMENCIQVEIEKIKSKKPSNNPTFLIIDDRDIPKRNKHGICFNKSPHNDYGRLRICFYKVCRRLTFSYTRSELYGRNLFGKLPVVLEYQHLRTLLAWCIYLQNFET